MDKRIINWVSTFARQGDGYTNYSVPVCEELTRRGYIIFGLGVSYDRMQHPWNFGVTHAKMQLVPSILASLHSGLAGAKSVVALDIPQHIEFLQKIQKNNANVDYNAIYAVESDPLSSTWAMHLMGANKHFTISQFGSDECGKAGIEATHLPATLDLDIWKLKTQEEQRGVKDALGLSDKIVLFMNADGNERKNTALVFETLAEVKKQRQDFHFILLTRTKSPVGWDYNELMTRFGLNGFVTIMDRGLKQSEVRNLYVAADFVTNVTKAEGLGMAILEAQAVGTPVFATNVTGMKENIGDGKAIVVDPDFKIVDIFGNGYRYFVSPEKLAGLYLDHFNRKQTDPASYDEMIAAGRANVESRTPQKTADILEKVLYE